MLISRLRVVLASAVLAASLTAHCIGSSPETSEIRYLSGTGSDDPVDWEFFCTKGRRSGEWITIPVPSNWEFHGFGSYNYGHDRPKADEQGKYRHRFEVPAEWRDRQVLVIFEGVMTDALVSINGRQAGPLHQPPFPRPPVFAEATTGKPVRSNGSFRGLPHKANS